MENKIDKMLLCNWVILAAELFTGIGIGLAFGKHLPKQVPLYYSRPWGEDQLGKPLELLIPLGLALGCGLLGGWIYKRMSGEKILAKLILISSMVIQLMLSLGVLRIVLLVS